MARILLLHVVGCLFFCYKNVVGCFGNLLVLQGSLMGCNIVSKCGNDS